MDIRPHRHIALLMDYVDTLQVVDTAADLYEHIGIIFLPAPLFKQHETVIQIGPEYGLDVLIDFRGGHDIEPHLEYLSQVRFGAQKLFVAVDEPISFNGLIIYNPLNEMAICLNQGDGFICDSIESTKALRESHSDSILFSMVHAQDPTIDIQKLMNSGADYLVVDELINGKQKRKDKITAAREFAEKIRPFT